MINRVLAWSRAHIALTIYLVLVVAVAVSYPHMVRLLNVQTAWVDIVSGRFTVSIFAALLAWVWIIEKLSKKRKWSTRKSWAYQLAGVMILVLAVTTG